MPPQTTTRLLALLAIIIPLSAILYYHTTTNSPTTTTMSHPGKPAVIVVGSGLAGLTASYAALRSGASRVHMLERAPKPGGNSIKASSGINGAGTPSQVHSGNEQDSRDLFYADTLRSAGRRLSSSTGTPEFDRRQKLIATLADNSAKAIDFLTTEIGVDLGVVARLGGHSAARTHRGGRKMPPGAAIVTTLLAKLKENPGFTLETNAAVTSLITSPPSSPDNVPAVTGVSYTHPPSPEVHHLSGPVIFATGGFAGDTYGLLARYRPDLAGLPSTNDARPGSHNILTSVGAELIDMDSVQVHPTGFIDPANRNAMVKFLAAEMLRGEGGVLLRDGKRFVDELSTREVVSGKIMDAGVEPERVQMDGDGDGKELRQWDVQLLLDPGATAAAGNHVGFYLFKGLMKKVKVKELDEVTRQTLEEYTAVVRGEKKDELGRTSFGHWTLGLDGEIDPDAEVTVGNVTPITHFTMGGVMINEKGQVLASKPGDPSTKLPIEGLFAAGEITGGLHGDNRLGGSSLLECVVFGQIIGQEASCMEE